VEEQRDTSHTVRNCPLTAAEFVRLGGANPSSATTKNPMHGSIRHFAQDVAPPAQVKFSGPGTAMVLDDDAERAVVSDPRESVTASAATEGADGNAVTCADDNGSAQELDDTACSKPSLTDIEQDSFHRLQELSQWVKAGDDSAMAEIRGILDGNDALWRQLGDVETTTEAMLIEFAEGTAASKESVRRNVAAMKQSLLGEQPTPLERMAVGRVVACWLFAHFVDRWAGWSLKAGGRAGDLAKILEAAEKRYGTALKSLKLVQRIKSPAC
jgi:hypothetical protein